jgi:hypothetical protein
MPLPTLRLGAHSLPEERSAPADERLAEQAHVEIASTCVQGVFQRSIETMGNARQHAFVINPTDTPTHRSVADFCHRVEQRDTDGLLGGRKLHLGAASTLGGGH